MPTHPASLAGIRLELQTFNRSGYLLKTGVKLEAVISSTRPTTVRQGIPFATFAPDNAWHTVDIGVSAIPAAGTVTYIGIRVMQQANYGERADAWNWPWMANATQLDDSGVEYMGRSCHGLVSARNATFLVYSSSGGDLGTADSPAKAPYEGGWTWHDAGSTGSPVYGVADGTLYLRATAPSSKGFLQKGEYEDDDEPPAPWDDVRWGLEVLFDISAAGLTDQAGARNIEVTTTCRARTAGERSRN